MALTLRTSHKLSPNQIKTTAHPHIIESILMALLRRILTKNGTANNSVITISAVSKCAPRTPPGNQKLSISLVNGPSVHIWVMTNKIKMPANNSETWLTFFVFGLGEDDVLANTLMLTL